MIAAAVRYFFILTFVLASLSAASGQAAPNLGQSKYEKFGTVIESSKWRTRTISVCWEEPAPGDLHFRSIVEKAVQETWVEAAQGAIVIALKWPACDGDPPGIRIAVSDTSEGAHTNAIGRYLDKMPHGMTLNFTFNNWSQGCQSRLDFCVYAVAAHEFGHALGFTHEQNREDAPKECRDEKKSGSVGDYNVTKYDPTSIMNYCNPAWNGDGKLSQLDMEAVRTFYSN
jgi:hypothetical protein